jgi:hypothetical protein
VIIKTKHVPWTRYYKGWATLSNASTRAAMWKNRRVKTDLVIKDFQLAGVRNVIIDVTLHHEFHGSCANLERNGEPSHLDDNGTLDAVKEKLVNYQHDYSERQLLLPSGSHDDLRENQRRLSPPGIHTISSPSSALFHTHGHP